MELGWTRKGYCRHIHMEDVENKFMDLEEETYFWKYIIRYMSVSGHCSQLNILGWSNVMRYVISTWGAAPQMRGLQNKMLLISRRVNDAKRANEDSYMAFTCILIWPPSTYIPEFSVLGSSVLLLASRVIWRKKVKSSRGNRRDAQRLPASLSRTNRPFQNIINCRGK